MFAVCQPIRPKSGLKHATNRGNERAAAGQENPINLVDRHAFPLQQLVDGLLDPGDVVGNPALKILTGDLLLDIELAEPENEICGGTEDSRTFASETARYILKPQSLRMISTNFAILSGDREVRCKLSNSRMCSGVLSIAS